MRRATINAVICSLACVLMLAIYAAVDGYYHGAGANHQHPPGFQGMVLNTMIWTVFFGPTAGGIGLIAGFGAGLVHEAIRGWRRTAP